MAMERNNELSGHIDSSGQETMNSQNEQIFCLPTIMASPNSSWSSDSRGKMENGAQRGYERREVNLDYIKLMDGVDGNTQNDTQLMENPTIISSLSAGNGTALSYDTNTEPDRNRPNNFIGIRSKRHLDIVEEVRFYVEVLINRRYSKK